MLDMSDEASLNNIKMVNRCVWTNSKLLLRYGYSSRRHLHKRRLSLFLPISPGSFNVYSARVYLLQTGTVEVESVKES